MADESLISKWRQEISQKMAEDAGMAIPSNATPGFTYPDTEIDQYSRELTESIQAQQSIQEGVHKHDYTPPPPQDITEEGYEMLRDFTNFMAADALALVGVSWTKSGIEARAETARDMLVEHPFRAALAFASTIAPAAASVVRMAKAGKTGIAAEHLVSAGLIDNIEEYNKLAPKYQTIVQGQAMKIGEIQALRTKYANGTISFPERAKLAFHERFGNSYMDQYAKIEADPQGVLKDWQDKVKNLTSGRAVNEMLDLATTVKKEEGTAILQALKDPSKLSKLSPEARNLALMYSTDARRTQQQMLSEGFIDQETADKIGDVWFSTLRTDSPMFDQGATTSKLSIIGRRSDTIKETEGSLRIVNVPRTSTPHLKERQLDSAGLSLLLKRQEAAEALAKGKTDKALSILPESEAEAINLIKSGRYDEAKGILGRDGFIDADPKSLVVNSHLQQRLIFENFRTLRDLALDSRYTKSAEEVAAMHPSLRKRMMSLDKVANAATLRRMVATKQGKNYVDRLGYVHESVFHELAEVDDTIRSGGMTDLLTVASSIHKTMKTAANPFAHGQNVGGNMVLLAMGGMNPTKPENYKVLRTSWKAVHDWQNARKEGKAMTEIADLGKLKSNIKGGKDINIAEEIMNPLLSGPAGILDMTSIEASEGLPFLAKMYDQADDHQIFVKGFIKGFQRVAKAKLPGTKWSIERASQEYMAEDSATKLAYYLHLRREGLNPTAAALEVGKRLPMYNTLGTAQSNLRRFIYPWISFPTEITRIMKNNMMDYPIRTAMWMHTPHLVQAGVAIPQGMSYEEVQERKEQNPMWAQKSTAVVTGLRDANDNVRTALLDILPWSALSPSSEAVDAEMREKLPMGLGNPIPIIGGFIDAMMGRGQFGEDIATDPENPSSKLATIVMNVAGMMAPPLLQKYAMQPQLANPAYRFGIDTGQLVNPSTGETGDWRYDAILNNFFIKNYAGSPEQKIATERFGERKAEAFRGRLGREFSAWARSGRFEEVSDTVQAVFNSYLTEDPSNPAAAMNKTIDWLKLHAKDALRHPAFKGVSKEDFIRKLTQIGNEVSPKLNVAQREYIEALKQGYSSSELGGNPLTRGFQKKLGGGFNQGFKGRL